MEKLVRQANPPPLKRYGINIIFEKRRELQDSYYRRMFLLEIENRLILKHVNDWWKLKDDTFETIYYDLEDNEKSLKNILNISKYVEDLSSEEDIPRGPFEDCDEDHEDDEYEYEDEKEMICILCFENENKNKNTTCCC